MSTKTNQPLSEAVDPKTVKNAQAITAVRELLFGDDMSEADNRLQEVHDKLQKEISTLRDQVSSLKEQLGSKLERTIAQEQTRHLEEIEKVKKEAEVNRSSLQKSFDRSVAKLGQEKAESDAALATIFTSAAAALKSSSTN